MQSLLLTIFDDWAASLNVGIWLIVALVLVTLAIGIATVVVAVIRLIIFWNYWLARRPNAGGITGEQAANAVLQHLGVTDVQVVKEGIFRALFFGNHYNPKKKTVYLRRTTFFGKNISAVALAAQKAALVIQDNENSAKFRSRWRLQRLALFGPVIFIPLVLLGLIVDIVISLNGTFTGIGMLAATAIALLFFILSAVLTGLTVSVEKRGTNDATRLLEEMALLPPEELAKAKKVLKTYILAYITDFIIAILKMIQLILKLFLQLLAVFSKKK